MNMEAETEVMHLLAKELQASLAMTGSYEEDMEAALSHILKNNNCQHPDFRVLALRSVRKYISVVLSHQFVLLCYSSCRK